MDRLGLSILSAINCRVQSYTYTHYATTADRLGRCAIADDGQGRWVVTSPPCRGRAVLR